MTAPSSATSSFSTWTPSNGVEVVRGPGSSLYGSNAFFGVVNVLTRKGRSLDGVEVSASAGSFGAYKGRVSYGTRLEDGPEIFLSGSFLGSDGQTLYYPEYNDPATQGGFSQGADGEQAWNLFGDVSWAGFTLQGAYVAREKHIPTGSYSTVFGSRDTITWDDRAYLDLKYEHEFEEKLALIARVNLDAYWYHADYQYDAPPLYLNKDSATGCAWGGEVQLSKPFFEDRALVTVGGEVRDNFVQDQKNYDYVTPRVTHLDSRESSYVLAVYGQADVRVLDPLRLNLGVRYDYYDTFGSSVSPRVSLVYDAAEMTVLKALYGRAFRAPSAYELYYSDNGLFQKANPGLGPETVDTFELVVEQGLAKGIQAAANGFYYRCHDLISTRLDPGDGLVYFDNVSDVRALGGALELRVLLEGGVPRRRELHLPGRDEPRDRQLAPELAPQPGEAQPDGPDRDGAPLRRVRAPVHGSPEGRHRGCRQGLLPGQPDPVRAGACEGARAVGLHLQSFRPALQRPGRRGTPPDAD
jgi:outer membrane receptor for ferrienterochelin and colicins